MTIHSAVMHPQRYKIKSFYYQYSISLLALANLSLPLQLQTKIFAFLIISIIKYRVQGLRINSPFLLLPILSSLFDLGTLLVILFSLLNIFLTKILTVYNIPSPAQTLSYKTITLQNNMSTIFYPTKSTKNISKVNLYNSDIGDRMFDMLNKDPGKPSKYPKYIISMASNYYKKMTMGNVIHNAPCIEKQYQLIIISHQLGFNSLYSLAREFVDSGYMVMLIDHPEEIINIHPDASNPANRQFRTSQLHTRFNAVKNSLDFILDDSLLGSHMGPNVKIKKDRVHILGHSFGGSTALYSAMNDSRITGNVISLDPCFFIFDDAYTLLPNPQPYSRNTLIILAEDYYVKHYDFFQNDFRARVLRDNCKNLRVLRMLGSNHANFSELSLFTSGQFHRLKVIRNSNTALYFQMFLCLSYQILRIGQSMPQQNQIIETLAGANTKYKKQIRQSLKSILEQNHKRLIR